MPERGCQNVAQRALAGCRNITQRALAGCQLVSSFVERANNRMMESNHTLNKYAAQVSNLSIAYGSKQAVRQLSFQVGFSEIVAILGPNGAGKTSTMESLEGYKQPTQGTVTVLDMDPAKNQVKLAAQVGVMLQQGGVYPAMNPLQALKLFSSYYETPAKIDDLISLLSLDEFLKTPYRKLSGGEQKKLLLALSLIGNPKVLFLDEPTAGVDFEGRLAIRKLLVGLKERGAAILLATHELNEAEKIADRIIIINHGELIAQGDIQSIRSQYDARDLEEVYQKSMYDRGN